PRNQLDVWRDQARICSWPRDPNRLAELLAAKHQIAPENRVRQRRRFDQHERLRVRSHCTAFCEGSALDRSDDGCGLRTIQRPMTRLSSALHSNVWIASRGDDTIGSPFRLNEVFRMTGIPVRLPSAVISEWNNGLRA